MSALSWQPIAADDRVGALAASTRVDPYLLWALRTKLADAPPTQMLPFMIERALTELPPELKAAYHDAVAQALPVTYATQFDTAFVSFSKIGVLAALVSKGAIARYQLAMPRGEGSRSAVMPVKPTPGDLETVATLGVIDDGCCIAHRHYRQGSGGQLDSRFLYVWDQRRMADAPLDTPWKRYGGAGQLEFVGYGDELRRDRIVALLGDMPASPGGERKFYADQIHRKQWTGLGHTHGASVLHILTGHGGRRELNPARDVAAPSATAPIVFVQLPYTTVEDSSGGSLGFYVLDGVRYIVERTRELVKPHGHWQTTINISLGSIAGPHDGTTMTEMALDELARQFPGRIRLVMAAGNTASRRIHAEAVVAPGTPAVFSILVPPAQRDESYVEFWFPIEDGAETTLTVKAPGQTQGQTVGIGQGFELAEGGTAVACLIAPNQVAQGLNGTMALLALRGTKTTAGEWSVCAPYGVWTVTVASSVAMTVRAWVERNETIIGRRSGQRTHFVTSRADGVALAADIVDTHTLSSLAHGENVTVVGAYTRLSSRMADDSARGPIIGREEVIKPDWAAPSSETQWMRGVRVPGFFSGSVSRVSGTSAAAPRGARLLADDSVGPNQLSIDPETGVPLVK